MESLKLFSYSRTSTIILLKKLEEKIWDEQPSGFSNTIRWNAGHVYSTAEDFLVDADAQFKNPLPEWDQLFLDGTRPSEWPEDIPSAQEIIQALEEQKERIELFFNDKLHQDASVVRDVNGTLLDKVDSALQFVTWHEGIHLGVTNSLGKVLQ